MVIEAAEAAGIECVTFNQRHTAYNDLVVDYKCGRLGGVLSAWGKEYRLEDFSGIYTRIVETASLPELKPSRTRPVDSGALERAMFLSESLGRWIDIAPCRVLNRSIAMSSNSSKPYQAQLIQSVGFSTPTTLISNDPDQVREFAAKHGELIFKSISGVRSIVKKLSTERMENLHRIRSLPTQFQAFVPGTNVRVHVVGEQVFATEIVSDTVDYRYGSREGIENEMSAYELPDAIRDRCVRLSKSLNLPLCGIDFKRTPDGEYVCFEVNPSPAYSYYEENAGQPISSAIVEYLAGK